MLKRRIKLKLYVFNYLETERPLKKILIITNPPVAITHEQIPSIKVA
jgi:hypothetical protein